ncbi:MAG: hypothetical protein IPL26_24725 [Leptospiraceae bacterium]|nr:hypothetical protein [Leptospiraceae bacterium]
MQTSRIIRTLFILILFITIPSFTEEKNEKKYIQQVLLENFESIKITNNFLRIQANTNYLPEIRMSKQFVSPNLISDTSLLIIIPIEGEGIPMDLIFPKPYIIEEYLIEFEFHIYSNQTNADFFIYIQDTHFQKHQILVAHLNFDGWKSFKIPIGNKINQRDSIIGKPSFLKLTGIQINPTVKERKTKEDIIAIDDIFITKRKKYDLPQDGLDIFH